MNSTSSAFIFNTLHFDALGLHDPSPWAVPSADTRNSAVVPLSAAAMKMSSGSSSGRKSPGSSVFFEVLPISPNLTSAV